MEKQSELTPEQSLQIINKMIEERKQQFLEDGFMFRLWGWLIVIAALGNIVLLHLKMYDICWYPWFLMPLGCIYTVWYYKNKYKEKKGTQSHIGMILASLGWVFGINAMLIGFIGVPFWVGELYTGIILLLLAMTTIVSGVTVKFRPLIIGGVICNLLAYASFAIVSNLEGPSWKLQLIFLIVAIFATNIIPGYMLKANSNKNA